MTATDAAPTGSAARRYDLLSRLSGIHRAQWQLVAQAGIGPTATVLDLGTGTGDVALKAKRAVPSARVIGLDPDPGSLARAAQKASRAGLDLELELGRAGHLPHPDSGVDRVLSSLALHHLDADEKVAALREVHRVLAPGGSVHLLDLTAAGPVHWGLLLRGRHGHHDHAGHQDHAGHHEHAGLEQAPVPRTTPAEEVLGLLAAAGLVGAVQVGEGRSALGRHALYRASR